MPGERYKNTRSTLGSLHWMRVSEDEGANYYWINEEVSFTLSETGQQVLANSHNSPYANQKKAGRADNSAQCSTLFVADDMGQDIIKRARRSGRLLKFKSMLEPEEGAYMERFDAIVLTQTRGSNDNQITTFDFTLDISGEIEDGLVEPADLA